MNKNKKLLLILSSFIFIGSAYPKFTIGDAVIYAGAGAILNLANGYLLERINEEQVKRVNENQDYNFKIEGAVDQNSNNRRTSNSRPNNSNNEKTDNKVYFKDVIGLDGVLCEVTEVVDFLKNPQRFEAFGAKMPKGILLEGPPGTGKTLIAKAIANEVGCNFYYESASSFVEMYVGVGAKRVRELFNKARKGKPAIVFIDEIDAIGAVSRGAGGNEEYRQTLNQLLTELDGFEKDDSIIIIAATNNANALDKALIRPKRFSRIIKVPRPDKDGRRDLLLHYTNKLPKVEMQNSDVEEFVNKTTGFSGADLENLVNEAAMHAVRANANFVERDHFDQAYKKIIIQRS